MDRDLADFAVKYTLEKGASYAEARIEHHEVSGFILKNGNPEISGFDKVSGLGIRFLIRNSLGFLSINDLTKGKIKTLINKSLKLTKNSSRIGKTIDFSHAPSVKKNYKVIQKINVRDKSPEEKLKIISDLDKEIKDVKSRYLSFTDELSRKYYVNSEGTQITSEVPRVNFLYYLTIIENNKSIQRYNQYGAACGFECVKKWNLSKNLLKEISALKNSLRNAISPPKGKLDVVASPEVIGIAVHESVGHPYEADRIFGREAAQAGESFVTKGMLNTKIGSSCVNVVDDPTIENSAGFFLYDDEGVKARRKFLIKKGKINEFLHNRPTSATMKIESNGSARANNYNVEPIIRMSNTFMLPGTYTKEELIEDIKLGVLIENFMEWNIDDKRFNQKYVGSEAYLIKNGKLDKPVKNPALEITTPALWSSIDAAGKEVAYTAGNCGKGQPMQAIPVFFGGPYARLRNVMVK